MIGVMEVLVGIRASFLQLCRYDTNFRCGLVLESLCEIPVGRKEVQVRPDEDLCQFFQFASAGRKFVQQLWLICETAGYVERMETYNLGHRFGPRKTCFSIG